MTRVYNKNELKNRRQSLRNNLTKAEEKIWIRIRNKQFLNLKFRRQFSFGYYIADFYCKELRLVIEIDGDSHFTNEGRGYDEQRSNYLQALGLTVIRFTNKDIYENIEKVLEVLREVCKTPSDSPLVRGRV